MSINLKALRESAERIEVLKARPDVEYTDAEWEEYFMPREIFELQESLAGSVPALLNWIERAKKIIETATNHECHRAEKGRCGLCTDCEALDLLNDLEEPKP